MSSNRDLLESAKNGTMRKGKSDLIKHLNGKRLTQGRAIRAKCYDCNGMGESDECDIETCPLLPYSPYKIKSTDPTFKGKETQE